MIAQKSIPEWVFSEQKGSWLDTKFDDVYNHAIQLEFLLLILPAFLQFSSLLGVLRKQE